METYKEFKLNNSLIVALQRTLTQTICAVLRINYGPVHEREGEEGLAHYLEHCLVSGGSEKYHPSSADAIRSMFGFFNAYTSIGRTCFVGNMLAEDLEAWLDYVSEHVFRPRFDKDAIDGERERVLREISDEKSLLTYQDDQKLKNIFYRGHPKGRFVLGKEEVVKSANQEILRRFHSRGYHPNNMDLIVVGRLPKNVEGVIEKYFGQVPGGENMRIKFPELTPLDDKIILRRPAPERLNIDNPKESSALIQLKFFGPAFGHEDECAAEIMNQIWRTGLSKNVGLKKGLAYDIGSFYNGSYNAGEFTISASVSTSRIDEAVGAIFEEIHRMKTQKQDAKTIDGVKRQIKYELVKAFESNEGFATTIGDKLDRGQTIQERISGFDSVTPNRVMEVANKYLPDRENGKYILYIRDPLQKYSDSS